MRHYLQRKRHQHRGRLLAFVPTLVLALGLILSSGQAARAQLPTLPGAPGTPAANDSGKVDTASAPTKDNPEATVAATSGPISIDKPVEDKAVEKTLLDLLTQYPGVTSVDVQVKHGVVMLEGQVDNEDVRNNVTQFTRRIEGVRLILNRMKTDAQTMTAWQLAAKVLMTIWSTIARKWLIVLIALAIVIGFTLLARLFNTYSETLLAPFVKNVLLRSVFGSFVSSLLFLGGIMVALSVLDLTHVVLSILGVASILGLAVGFAFRDITENFIASILLGMRRPFSVGDYVQVAGKAGIVRTLNTRATVLVTLEGNHVRIPNATIYKEILVNSSASSSVRGTFDVIIPYEASTASALEAVSEALEGQEGILNDPPARALVDALEADGVRLRAYFWMPSQGIDASKLLSDAKLKAKVALQQAGISPPPTTATITIAGRVPVDLSEVDGHAARTLVHPGSVVTKAQAEANLRRDSRAAAKVSIEPAEGEATPAEHVMNEAETRVSDEGENLLAEPEPASADQSTMAPA